MIRRKIHFHDMPTQWLLLSQVEHARLSGILAEHSLYQFGQSLPTDLAEQVLDAVRRELQAAIVHHDDGWADWEAKPQLDDELGQPLSFLELPLEELLPIWDESIRVSLTLGKLAAWIVAGHFQILLEASEDNRDTAQAKNWLGKVTNQRQIWLAEWQAKQPEIHTVKLAEEALLWLRLCDILSLWTCMTCPGVGERIINWPGSYTCGKGLPLETVISPISPEDTDAGQVQLQIDPWWFDVPEIALEALGQRVPIQNYQSTAELIAAHSQQRISWLFVPVKTMEPTSP